MVDGSWWQVGQGGCAAVQYSRDVLKDIEMGSAFQQEAVWQAIKKLRKLVDKEQAMPKAPPAEEAPSVRDLGSTVFG